jgi:glycosyltransferase involved in cell wall biosynthesis
VSTLAGAQRRAGHRVVVAPTLSAPGDARPFLASLEAAGVEIEPLIISGRGYLTERGAVAALGGKIRASVVHTHGYRSDIVGGWGAGRAGIPRVTTVHGFTGGGVRNRGYEILQRLSFRRFDAVVAVSRALAADLRRSGVPSERLHTLPNALATHASPLGRDAARAALALPATGFIAGWVGRVSREKGVDVFVDAVSALEDCGASAAILGDGPERAREEQRSRAGRPGAFFWLGTVADAARYFAAFDVLVLSSRTEGMPMVLLEAMAAGIPIVSSNVGGVPELLTPHDAMLVPADDVAALAAAIRAVQSDPAAAAARARAARERQRTAFAVPSWSARYEAIYRSVLRPSLARAEERRA